MSNLSLLPMRFGSEDDFKTAVTELKWTLRTFGKISEEEYESVSSKYSFPVGFLKKGVSEGLKEWDDYRIAKSPWFPILYSWKAQNKEAEDKFVRLQIDYLSSKSRRLRSFTTSIALSVVLVVLLGDVVKLDFLTTALLVITFGLFLAGLWFQLMDPVSEKRLNLEEYKQYLKQKGLSRVIETGENYVKSNSRWIGYAGDILKKKFESAIELTIFKCHIEGETLCVEDSEDPDAEYQRRIAEIGTSSS